MADSGIKLKYINAGSIPADVLSRVSEWKVKNAFITKHAENVKRATSKMHRFKPAVTLMEALQWSDQFESNDVTLVFENDSSIRFEENQYKELTVEEDE